MGNYSINKPVFPDLPPIIVGFPFFFSGIAFFFGAKLLQRLRERDQNSKTTKFLISLAFLIPLFSFSLFGYLVDHLPLKYKKILGTQSFEETFTPIENMVIENMEMGIRLSKPEGWNAYRLDLDSNKALFLVRQFCNVVVPVFSVPICRKTLFCIMLLSLYAAIPSLANDQQYPWNARQYCALQRVLNQYYTGLAPLIK